MAVKGGTTIIIKKKGGHHGGHHGGAWKVAYADFVTAMMAFFMVMWLMGSDDGVKQAISKYFNNPTSAWRPDLTVDTQVPLGEQQGSGDNILTGTGDGAPQDLVERPSRPFQMEKSDPKETGDLVERVLGDRNTVQLESIRFTIFEKKLFKPDTEELSEEAKSVLDRVGNWTRGSKMHLSIFAKIKGPTDQGPGYDLALAKAARVSKYLQDQRTVDLDRVKTKVEALQSETEDSKLVFEIALPESIRAGMPER